jgi:NAD(P)-dependent dehydrogenase (short-subunit alcohol dehydrogenase family)
MGNMALPVALVTGAGRGIGRGIALQLHAAGYAVAANYRADAAAAESLQKTIRDSGGVCEIVAADVGDAAGRAAMLDFCKQEFGRLDLLVNNAGVAPEVRVDMLETIESSFDRQIAINVKGPYFLTQAAAKWMIEQRAAGTIQLGRIVFITSVSAFAVSNTRGEYFVAKSALAMTAALWANRMAGEGVLVFDLRPGIIETDMVVPVKEYYNRRIAEGMIPQNRWGTPEDVGLAVRAVAEGRLDYSTGAVIDISGGFQLHKL